MTVRTSVDPMETRTKLRKSKLTAPFRRAYLTGRLLRVILRGGEKVGDDQSGEKRGTSGFLEPSDVATADREHERPTPHLFWLFFCHPAIGPNFYSHSAQFPAKHTYFRRFRAIYGKNQQRRRREKAFPPLQWDWTHWSLSCLRERQFTGNKL